MTEVTTTHAPCTSCGRAWTTDDFYAGCGECKTCKRDRSRRNRADTARRLALAERMVDALVTLAEQGWHPDCTRAAPVTSLRPASVPREGVA